MSGFNESGDNRQVTEVGDSMSAQWQQHARDWRRVLCAVKRDHGRKEVLKNTLQKQTPQSRMAYSDALTMELLEIQPTRLLLNVTGSAMWTVCPSHGPPPQSQHSLPFPELLHSEYCSTVTPAFVIQNAVCVNEDFTPYPFCFVH